MKGQPLPAAIRGLIAGRWKDFDEDGRFGEVTESRVRAAIASYEKGSLADDAFSQTVFGICDEMSRTWDTSWAALGPPSEGPSAHQQAAPPRGESVPVAPSPAEQVAFPSSNYILRLWRGDVPLVVTYWLWGILLNLGLTLMLTFASAPSAAVSIVYLLYYAFIIVAIWRSSEKYRGRKLWGALARISVMLGVVRTLMAIFGGVY